MSRGRRKKEKKQDEAMLRAALSLAVTPSRPSFGGSHAETYADSPRCTEGSHRLALPTTRVLLHRWPFWQASLADRQPQLLIVGV
jgi:hypothetical protein